MAVYRESSLSTSKLYQDIKELTKQDQTEKAINLIKKAQQGSNTVKELNKEDIETAYLQLKQYSHSFYKEALRAYDIGKVKLIYNTEGFNSISQAIPFLTFMIGGKWVSYVFVDNYVVMDRRTASLTFPPDRLRDLLIGALVGNALREDYMKLTSNQFLQKIIMEIYTKFMCRILAKEYSVPSNKILYDQVQYWCNRFFLDRVFNSVDSEENIEKIATHHIRYLDEMILKETKIKYDEAKPQSAEDLIALIREAAPILKTLTISVFLSAWLKYYYPPSLLAIENIEYLIFMIIVLMHGNHSILNIAAQSIVTETKNIKSLNEELLKLVTMS